MKRVFHHAKRRAEFARDPPRAEHDVYVRIGTSKGMPKLRSGRGTQSTEEYHGISNIMVGADNLRPHVGKNIIKLGNNVFNIRR
eukprot:2074559-Rhodomonas_salina.1